MAFGPKWLVLALQDSTNHAIRDYFTGTGGDRRNNLEEHDPNRNKAQQNNVYMWCAVLCLYFHPGLLSGCWVNTQHGLSSSLENPQPFNHFSKDNIFGKAHLVSTRMHWGRLCVRGIASKFITWSSVWISVTPSGKLPINWYDVKIRWWQYLMESHVQNSVYNSSPCFVCGIFNALNRRHHTFSGKLWHN